MRVNGSEAYDFTVRKQLKFADRTPNDPRGVGPFDWGNMLNYWAPAFLCMWLVGDVRELCKMLDHRDAE